MAIKRSKTYLSLIHIFTGVLQDLVADGNSVILVDHDTQILKESDWLIEMGPEAGAKGGHIIAQGNICLLYTSGTAGKSGGADGACLGQQRGQLQQLHPCAYLCPA